MRAQLDIGEGEFYHLSINGDETLFESQEGAVEYIKENKGEIDLENPDVKLALVETDEEEWAIEGVPWQTIALQLL